MLQNKLDRRSLRETFSLRTCLLALTVAMIAMLSPTLGLYSAGYVSETFLVRARSIEVASLVLYLVCLFVYNLAKPKSSARN